EYEHMLPATGMLGGSVRATRMVHNITQLTSLTPSIENAGLFGRPLWNATASLWWQRHALRVGWEAQYLDSFWLNRDHTVGFGHERSSIGSATYHDINIQYTFD